MVSAGSPDTPNTNLPGRHRGPKLDARGRPRHIYFTLAWVPPGKSFTFKKFSF